MKIVGIIPARYESSRFPGKPLAMIAGKTMIQRVYEQCLQATLLSEVIIATDDERIMKAVEQFSGKVVMTNQHPNGTSRCAEVSAVLPEQFEAVINIQGDEPMIHPAQINQIAEILLEENVKIATLVRKEFDLALLGNENIVKALRNTEDMAYNFKRQLDKSETNTIYQQGYFYQHVGLYGFKTDVLQQLTHLTPTTREETERLEQLRWLEHGFKIKTAITNFETHSIDTQEDLNRIRHFF